MPEYDARVNGVEPRQPAPRRGNEPSAPVARDLLQLVPALIAAIDAHGTIRFWNQECRRVLGYAQGEVVGRADALERLLPDRQRRAALLAWWRADDVEPATFEVELIDAAGQPRAIVWHRTSGIDCPGAAAPMAVGHDLTEQRRTERELRESRERLRTAFEHVPLDFWIMDATGRYAMVNPAAASRWGDHLGKTVAEARVPPEVRARWQEVNSRAFAGQTVRGETEYASDGLARAYEYVVAPIRHPDGSVSGILGVNIDITERKHAEHERERSEATRHAILDALPDLMFRMSAEGRYLDYHAPPHFSLLAPPDRFMGRLVTEVVPPELAEACLACIRRTLSFGGVQRYEYAVPGNPARQYEVRMTPCGPDEVVALVRNISDIKQTEQNLRESESRFRAIFDSSPLGIFVIQDDRVAMANSSGLALLGAARPTEVIGQDAIRFVAERYRTDASGCVATALRDGRSPPHVEDLLRLDGTEVTVEAAGARIELGGRPAIQVIAQDVTKRLRDQEALRQTDEQLRQSQKMEAVGQLAAGVAHDFNNLLTAIFGYVSLARSSLDESSPAWTALDGVHAAAEQASGVIRALLAVSRKAVAQFTDLDLAQVASGALDLLRAGLPSTITVQFEAPAEPVPVRGDSPLLKQVVLNLAINARDAMPRGGTLRLIVRGPDGAGLASLRVEDSGEGISPEVRARVFEPFFTTKNRESNSGLGLSIAEGIVRAHGGSIVVESEPGKGAAFTVRLPASGARAVALPLVRTAPTQRVLVADEARQVREVIGTALTRAGFSVTLAADPAGVTDALRHADPPVGVAIVNADTPEGLKIIAQVRASPGAIGVIALTASGAEPGAHGPASTVLRKPFQVAQIPQLVRQVFEKRSPDAGAAESTA